MSKLFRPVMYGSIGLVALAIGAVVMFRGGETPPEPEANLPVPPTETPKVEEPAPTDLEYGEGPISLVPVAPPAPAATEAAPQPATPKAEPVATGPRIVGYRLQSGDILGRVARKYGCSLQDIYRLNKDIDASNAHRLPLNKLVLVLDKNNVGGLEIEGANPTPANVQVSSPEPLPAGQQPQETRAPAPVPTVKEPEWTVQRTHNLKAGDTYFELSKRYYGSIGFWRVIRDANPQWRVLETVEGMEIKIPALRPQDVNGPAVPPVVQGGGGGNIIPPMRG